MVLLFSRPTGTLKCFRAKGFGTTKPAAKWCTPRQLPFPPSPVSSLPHLPRLLPKALPPSSSSFESSPNYTRRLHPVFLLHTVYNVYSAVSFSQGTLWLVWMFDEEDQKTLGTPRLAARASLSPTRSLSSNPETPCPNLPIFPLPQPALSLSLSLTLKALCTTLAAIASSWSRSRCWESFCHSTHNLFVASYSMCRIATPATARSSHKDSAEMNDLIIFNCSDSKKSELGLWGKWW